MRKANRIRAHRDADVKASVGYCSSSRVGKNKQWGMNVSQRAAIATLFNSGKFASSASYKYVSTQVVNIYGLSGNFGAKTDEIVSERSVGCRVDTVALSTVSTSSALAGNGPPGISGKAREVLAVGFLKPETELNKSAETFVAHISSQNPRPSGTHRVKQTSRRRSKQDVSRLEPNGPRDNSPIPCMPLRLNRTTSTSQQNLI